MFLFYLFILQIRVHDINLLTGKSKQYAVDNTANGAEGYLST